MRVFVFVVWVVKPDLFGTSIFYYFKTDGWGLFLFFWDMYGAIRFDGRIFVFSFFMDTMTDCTLGKVKCKFCGRCVFWRSRAWKPGRRNRGDYTGIPEGGFSFFFLYQELVGNDINSLSFFSNIVHTSFSIPRLEYFHFISSTKDACLRTSSMLNSHRNYD